MSAPRRIQRQRTKGWRMPEGAVYVGRPTRWGNPFRVVSYNEWASDPLFGKTPSHWWDGRQNQGALEDVVMKFRVWVGTGWHTGGYRPREGVPGLNPSKAWYNPPGYAGPSGHFAIWQAPFDQTAIHQALAGRDLACWCPLDQPCHADVLLELANGGVA